MAQNGIARTSAGLRETLFEAMDLLRKGDMDHMDAKALALLSKEVCRTVNLEMEIARLRLQYPADSGISVPSAITLGTPVDDKRDVPKVPVKV